MTDGFPSPRLRLALLGWSVLWTLGLPFALFYLRRRARKDPLYAAHLSERFGVYPDPLPGAVWIHAVSLGEVRSAVPLVRALLDRGERVVTTHFTPAGRREAERALAPEIAAGKVRVVWVPFEFGWTFRRFFEDFRPKFGLVMEVEIWPRMIMAARAAGVPLLPCNAIYTERSHRRDTTRTPVRGELMRGFAGALVKSDLQRGRFAAVGVPSIAVTGELRFAQPIPADQRAAGEAARTRLAPGRRAQHRGRGWWAAASPPPPAGKSRSGRNRARRPPAAGPLPAQRPRARQALADQPAAQPLALPRRVHRHRPSSSAACPPTRTGQ
jgi:3-deoxy-D-manno-octulosonic-acid transferase